MKVQVNSLDKVYLTTGSKVLKAKEKCGMTISNFIGDTVSGTLNAPSTAIEPDFSGVTDLGERALQYKFTGTQNIKDGAISFPDLTDVSGEYALSCFCRENSNITSASFPEILTISGQYAFNYAFYAAKLTSVTFPKLATITGNNCLNYGFGSMGAALTSVSFPELTSVNGNSCFAFSFSSTGLSSISFPKLTTINGNSAFSGSFSSCSSLTSVEFPELTTIINNNSSALGSTFQSDSYLTIVRFPKLNHLECSATTNSCFYNCFSSCARLTDIYFNALTTTSFVNSVRQFMNMFNSSAMSTSGNCTIHFPSNMETTIQGLNGYPNFGATAGRLTLAYDLPATN